jgi:hypothetical protein
VQKPLTNLVNSHAVTRQLMHSRIYVYLSVDKSKAQEPFQRRLAISDKTSSTNLPSESIRIEVLLELIRTPGCALDEKKLGVLLRKKYVIIKDDEVACVLAYYDIKKTDQEIIWLIRHSIDQLCRRMGSNYLFCETPKLSFYGCISVNC